MESESSELKNCIFCKIIKKDEKNSEILLEDEKFAIIKDIRPAATHHYLVLTKNHIKNPKCLTISDISLVEEMRCIGLKYLESKGGDLNDSLLGFHWPPFNSVNHLHLHVISPRSSMSLLQRVIFRPSFYFTTVDSLIEWLSQKS